MTTDHDGSHWDRYVRHIEIVDAVTSPTPVHVTTRGIYLDGELIDQAPPPHARPGERRWSIIGGSFLDTRVQFWVRARDVRVEECADDTVGTTVRVHVCGHEVLTPPAEEGLMPLHPELLHPDAPVSVVLLVERVTIRTNVPTDAPAARPSTSERPQALDAVR